MATGSPPVTEGSGKVAAAVDAYGFPLRPSSPPSPSSPSPSGELQRQQRAGEGSEGGSGLEAIERVRSRCKEREAEVERKWRREWPAPMEPLAARHGQQRWAERHLLPRDDNGDGGDRDGKEGARKAATTTPAPLSWEWVQQRGTDRSQKRLKRLCRKGVPPKLRPTVWFYASGGLNRKELAERAGGPTYAHLCGSGGDNGGREGWEGEGEARAAALHQIELDIPRTFPDHAWFQSAEGQAALRRVLVAVTAYLGSGTGYW